MCQGKGVFIEMFERMPQYVPDHNSPTHTQQPGLLLSVCVDASFYRVSGMVSLATYSPVYPSSAEEEECSLLL